MCKPIGPVCNLRCRYCFYLEKEKMFSGTQSFRMTDEVLESYVRQFIEAQDVPEIIFAWQGGEPTLMGLDFFRKAVALQRRYASGKLIQNSLQTNGTLLDDKWCAFLAENNFLVGLSLDGPPKIHDSHRVDKAGRGSFERVGAALRCMKKHGVEFNTLTVVGRHNSRRPLDVYRYLRDIGSGYIQFIPLVERLPDTAAQRDGLDLAPPPNAEGEPSERLPATEWSVEPRDYGDFLCAIFDEWVARDVGRTFVQIFDITLGNWVDAGGRICVFSETCGRALALEHNGDLYSCDHYVYPHYRLGNITETPLVELVESNFQKKFGEDKRNTLPRQCRDCEFLRLCNGGCPKHRFLRTATGEPNLAYLCSAHKRFFAHSRPAMERMAMLYRMGHAPAEIMQRRQKILS